MPIFSMEILMSQVIKYFAAVQSEGKIIEKTLYAGKVFINLNSNSGRSHVKLNAKFSI